MYVTPQSKLSFNTNVTKDAVLGPMRMILAASVCEAFSTVCPLTEYKYSPTWEGGGGEGAVREGEGRGGKEKEERNKAHACVCKWYATEEL